MTYFGFLAYFLVIPILLLAGFHVWNKRRGESKMDFQSGGPLWKVVGIHMILAIAYTTPWDNYLVATRVWYYNRGLVSGLVLGFVPIEEYFFFILETILVGLWWEFLARRIESSGSFQISRSIRGRSVGVLSFIWLGSAAALFYGPTPWTYFSIILFWALPPIALQLLFGADILWHHRRLVLSTILPATLYLSLCDSLAINSTTWAIDSAQSTGILIGRFPIEEGLFFLLTAALLTFGITLGLAQQSRPRLQEILRNKKTA